MTIYSGFSHQKSQQKYNLLLSKLITKFQQTLLDLISVNEQNKANKQQQINLTSSSFHKYKNILQKMKLLQEQKCTEPKFSQLCKPLLKMIQASQNKDQFSSCVRMSKSLSLNHQKINNYNKITNQTLYGIRSNKIRRTYQFNNNQKQSRSASNNQRPKKIKQKHKNLQLNQLQITKNINSINSNKKQYQNLQQNNQDIFSYLNQRKQISLPKNYRHVYSSKSQSNHYQHTDKYFKQIKIKQPCPGMIYNQEIQISSRAKDTNQHICKPYQAQSIQTQIFSFEVTQTPKGTVYNKPQKTQKVSKYKIITHKKIIDRTHIKKFTEQSKETLQ